MQGISGGAQKLETDGREQHRCCGEEGQRRKDRTHAAIASRDAGEFYNLKVLAENICKNDSNVTRFIILAKKPVYENNSSKISVCFEARHESGTLYNVLSHIIYNG